MLLAPQQQQALSHCSHEEQDEDHLRMHLVVALVLQVHPQVQQPADQGISLLNSSYNLW